MTSPLLSFLALAASLPLAARAPAPGQEDGWAPLPLPSICREPAPEIGAPPLWSGSHVVLDPSEDAPARLERRPYRLPVASVIELLEGDAVRRGRTLRFHRPAPPLLARGSADALEDARAVLEGLDAAGDALAIRLTATLVPGFDGDGAAVSASPPPEPAGGANVRTWSREVRSGDDVAFGERREETFLSGFDVQVAANSEAPDPKFGTAAAGRTVHLRAWRTAGGASVLVEGLLDLATIERAPDFDPGTFELGRLGKPVVHMAQLAFAGEVPSGGALRVAVRGAPLPDDAWTLWIEARTEVDAAAGWRTLDLALVESEPALPPLPHPGHGISSGAAYPRASQRLEPLTASALWGEVEMTLAGAPRDGGRARRPLLAYAPGLIVGPDGDGAVWREAESLVRAAEAARTRTAALRVASGGIEAVLPVASGAPARALIGTEHLLVTDYRLEIAPESWLAAPVVEKVFDGFLVQGALDPGTGAAFDCAWWSAATTPLEELDRGDTTHGRVEPVRRRHRAGRETLRAGEPPTDAVAADGGRSDGEPPPLRMQLQAR